MIYAGPYMFVQHLQYTLQNRIYALPGGRVATAEEIRTWARANRLPFEVVG